MIALTLWVLLTAFALLQVWMRREQLGAPQYAGHAIAGVYLALSSAILAVHVLADGIISAFQHLLG
jgi:hypothetical protein